MVLEEKIALFHKFVQTLCLLLAIYAKYVLPVMNEDITVLIPCINIYVFELRLTAVTTAFERRNFHLTTENINPVSRFIIYFFGEIFPNYFYLFHHLD